MSIADEIAEGLAKIIAQKVHELASGETLGKVAAKYGITLEAIFKANPELRSADPKKLQPGLKIKIPESPMDCAGRLQGLSIQEMIPAVAKEFGLNPKMFKELLRQETTTFNPNAVSPAGAVGLSQLMPGRVKDFALTDPKNPAQSLCAGAALLEDYLGKASSFAKDTDETEFIALLMYNGGPTRVSSYLRNPEGSLPKETRDYAVEIFNRMGKSVPLRFIMMESQHLISK